MIIFYDHESGSFLKQKVNSYLCIALISLMAFWTCLYYFVNSAEVIGNNYIANTFVSSASK
jgi:hypothetical protein